MDQKEYQEEVLFHQDIANNNKEGGYQILFWEVLPYKVPIATQSAMVLPYDMEGDILNDVGNMDKSVRMQYVHIAVLPLEEKSVVLAFYHKRDKIYRRLRHQINTTSREKVLQYINYLIFEHTENIYFSKTIEEELKNNFPNTYKYLLANRQKLDKRDKGNGNYENWFAYGRTQSLEKFSVKLFFPKMTNSYLNCIIEVDENLLYYNGQAILGNSVNDLLIIKKLMESTVFWYYIRKTSKPYSAGYFSIDGNYINNFGVCDLSQSEKEFVIKEENKSILNSFWETKYGITMLDSNE